jgi:hypothetical protein
MSRGAVQRWMVLLAVLLWSPAVLADDYPDLGFRMMNSSQNPFVLHVDARSTKPAGIDLALVEKAVQDAATAWENVPCAYTDFSYGGRTSGTPDATDGFNVAATWVTSQSDPLYEAALDPSKASAAVPLTYSGALYQCDIILNAVDFQWSTLTPTPAGFMDLQSAILRELGACQGLGYVRAPDTSVMYVFPEPGQSRRSISVHDQEHLCVVAPQTGAVGSPCATGTCSSGLTCVSTQAPDGATVKLCAKGCSGSTPGECPNPYACRASAAVPNFTSACLPPTQAITQVGKPCANETTCGSARALCKPEGELPSQFPDWTAGYCTQSCATGQPACPSGSGCASVGSERLCLQSCRIGTADCRAGYACAQGPEGSFCRPECHTTADCNPGGGTTFTCRACDSVCIPSQQADRSVGETCTTDAQCGGSNVCLRYQSSTTGVCAQPCGSSTCGCPFGTTCQPVGTKGEQLCVSNCTRGSCPSGTLCTPSGTGSACLPPDTCKSRTDCPEGFLCGLTGQCYDPASVAADAGPGCTICNDAGTQPPPPVPVPSTDGGTDGGTSGPSGCGCQGAPASAMAFFAALALLFALRGKRNWPQP